jgi:hypothetical protein
MELFTKPEYFGAMTDRVSLSSMYESDGLSIREDIDIDGEGLSPEPKAVKQARSNKRKKEKRQSERSTVIREGLFDAYVGE